MQKQMQRSMNNIMYSLSGVFLGKDAAVYEAVEHFNHMRAVMFYTD